MCNLGDLFNLRLQLRNECYNSRLPTAGPRLGGPQRREGRPTPPLPYQLLHCAVKNVSSTLPFSPIKQTKRCDPVACFRSRYASPMITRRTGTSSIRVLAFETASDSISNERSFSAGDRSFSARRPVVLHASMAGSSGVCALADATSMRVRSEYVNTRMTDSYSCLGGDISIPRRCKEPAAFEAVPKGLI